MSALWGAVACLAIAVAIPAFAQEKNPLKVCCTLTDLGSLVREIGGEKVNVSVFAKGTEDAHFIETRPSFIKELSTADLYLQAGLELEIGWAPLLLRQCRNARVQPAAAGYLDCSKVIEPLDIPKGPVDRSQGDVHAFGNPHYLLDPVNGLKVAKLIAQKLTELRPADREYFEQRYSAFSRRLAVAMIGEPLADAYPGERFEQLMKLADAGRLDEFLTSQGQLEKLLGWMGAVRPMRGAKVVADHNMWEYFFNRFGLVVTGYMEPKPGLAVTTRHLRGLVETMKQQEVKLVVAGSYFDSRHTQFVASNTGASAAILAHQVQAMDGASDYLAMFDYNLKRLIETSGRP